MNKLEMFSGDIVTTAVRRYYTATDIDYRTFWSGKSELAIHFGYFDEQARTHRQSLLRMNEVMAEYGRIKEDCHVVDAGCGFGGSSLWLAETIGCQVTGVNIVEAQVASSKAEAAKRNLTEKVNFITASFENTNLDEACADVVWALESLVHVGDRRKFLVEASRILKPGGRIVIGEYMISEPDDAEGRDNSAFTELLEGWAMPRLYSSSAYLEQARQLDLYCSANLDISENVRRSLDRLRKLVWIGLKVGRFLKRLHLYDADRLRHSEASRVLLETFDKGLWRYRIMVFEKHGRAIG